MPLLFWKGAASLRLGYTYVCTPSWRLRLGHRWVWRLDSSKNKPSKFYLCLLHLFLLFFFSFFFIFIFFFFFTFGCFKKIVILAFFFSFFPLWLSFLPFFYSFISFFFLFSIFDLAQFYHNNNHGRYCSLLPPFGSEINPRVIPKIEVASKIRPLFHSPF
jgi:hypothetical protein